MVQTYGHWWPLFRQSNGNKFRQVKFDEPNSASLHLHFLLPTAASQQNASKHQRPLAHFALALAPAKRESFRGAHFAHSIRYKFLLRSPWQCQASNLWSCIHSPPTQLPTLSRPQQQFCPGVHARSGAKLIWRQTLQIQRDDDANERVAGMEENTRTMTDGFRDASLRGVAKFKTSPLTS